MRNSAEIDDLLENAVALALGLEAPHPDSPRKLRSSRRTLSRRQHILNAPRRERTRVAA